MSMPVPWDYCYEWDGPYGKRKFSSAPHNGTRPARSIPIFTADQMHAYAAAAVEAEREQCALACVEAGKLASQMYGDGAGCIATADLCADAICARHINTVE